jgi:hypothetical protein
MADASAEIEHVLNRRRPGDLLFAALFFLLGAFLLSQIGVQTTWVKKGALSSQPGFWPAVSLGGMTLFGLVYLIGAWRGRGSREDRAVAEAGEWLRSLEYAGWFMAYVLATPVVGYLLATLVFTVALALRMGYRSRTTILAAAVMGVAIVVLFKSLLQVKIPGGAVYEHLPGALRNFMILYL